MKLIKFLKVAKYFPTNAINKFLCKEKHFILRVNLNMNNMLIAEQKRCKLVRKI
jgi:hypothetical protein